MHGTQNQLMEWAYTSDKAYQDPFNEIELDVIITGPTGGQQVVPAFWAGNRTWRVRYAGSLPGEYRYRTRCSDVGNPDLHDREGTLTLAPYSGANPLWRHGRLRVADDRRHLEHEDGTPFLWLGDTWWMALSKRLRWPEDFKELTADRVRKGFTVVQLVAGLLPDMEPFDERGANEAGFPWERDLSRVNPAYFDMADLRIAHLVSSGVVPCIFGSWGYFQELFGVEVLIKHWRYLIARYGAYPVVWCAAGEAFMKFYLGRNDGQDPQERNARLRVGWGKVVREIRAADPFHNLVTIHPIQGDHQPVDDPSLLDFQMLFTGHFGYPNLTSTINTLTTSLDIRPKTPVLVGEVCYEGIRESSREEIQRFLFWSCMLSGAAGHTYGANGIWQVNAREKPFGLSPHGSSWGNRSWEDASQLPGSRQLGLGKALLERYQWWQFEPHPEWMEPHSSVEDRVSCYAAGIPGVVRFILLTPRVIGFPRTREAVVRSLEPGLVYHGYVFDPATGDRYDLGDVTGDATGSWCIPMLPIFQDWVLVLEAPGAAVAATND